MAPLARQSQQIDKTETYRDGLTPNSRLESNSSSLEFDLNAIRTQIKNILGEERWYNPPQISIKTLFESVNRLWFRIESDSGFTVPTQEQDTLGIKGTNEITAVASDSGNDTITISYSKNVYKTIETNNGSLEADNPQDRLFFIGGDEISIAVTPNGDEITIAFAGTDPQKYWGLIAAATNEIANYPTVDTGGGWTTTTPTVQEDTFIITGSNGISTRVEAQLNPETDILIIESQDFSSGSGSPEFQSVVVTSLNEGEIVYSLSDFLSGDLSGLNYNIGSASTGINISNLSYGLNVKGDFKVHDDSLESLVNNTTYSNGTDIIVQNGHIVIFRDGPESSAFENILFHVFDEYSISNSTLKFSVNQPSEKRIVKGSALRGNFIITISDPDPTNSDTTVGYFDIWDITNFQSPTLIKTLSSTSFKGAQNLEIHGRYAFFGSLSRIVNIIDLLNIEDPKIAFQTNPSFGGGGVVNVKNKRLFAVNTNNGSIDVYDISSLPSNIVKESSINLFLNTEDLIASVGNYIFSLRKISSNIISCVYNGSNSSFSITDIFSSGLSGSTTAVSSSGNRVYITSGESENESIGVFQLQNESLILLYTESIPNTGAQRILVSGDNIYVVGSSRFRVLKEKSSRLTSGQFSMAKTGNLDVRNKFEITDTLSITGGMWVGPGGVHVDKGFGVSTDSNLNIKDQLLINTAYGKEGIEIHGGDIWVTPSENHSNYNSYDHEIIFNKEIGQDSSGIFYKDSVVYFGNNILGKIHKETGDIYSSTSSDNITGGTTSGEIKGNFLFVAPNTINDIVVYRISGNSIQEIASKTTGSSSSKYIKIVNNVAIIAYATGTTVRAYDISDPKNPVLMSSITISGTGLTGAVAIDSEDNFVYVAYGATNPNNGVVGIIRITDSSFNRSFSINQTITFPLSTRAPHSIKAYRNNLIVVPNNQGTIYIYDTKNKYSVNLIDSKDINPGVPFFSGRYLWINDNGLIRVYDYIPTLNNINVNPKYFFIARNGELSSVVNSILCDGNSYYIFGDENIARYRLSHVQFDAMELGASVFQEARVRKDFTSKNSIESQSINVGEDGLRVINNMKTIGSSSFLGRVSIGNGSSEHQFFVKDKAVKIEDESGYIFSEVKEYDAGDFISGGEIISSFAGGYVAFGASGLSNIGLNDVRFENYLSVGVGPNISDLGGDIQTFVMKGDLLFVHLDSQEIKVIDISRKSEDSSYPILSTFSTEKDYTDSIIFKNYLVLIDSDDSGSTIDFYDITDGSNLVLFSENSTDPSLGEIKGIEEYRGLLYVLFHKTSSDSTISIYRLEDNGEFTYITDDNSLSNATSFGISRHHAYVAENDGINSYIVSLEISEADLSFVSRTELSDNYVKKITVKGRYAVLFDDEASSDQIITVDISDPSNMEEIQNNIIISNLMTSAKFYGSSLILSDNIGYLHRSNSLGFKAQRGYIGSFSVDELLISEDIRILEKSSFYGGAFIGKGGVHVDKGNGIGTDGRLITTGSASFGHTDITNHNLSIKGDMILTPSSFSYGEVIYDYSWNSNTGYLFAYNGVLYPLIRNAWLPSISITGRTRAVDEQVYLSNSITQGFDGPNAGSDIAISGKYLFKLEFQNKKLNVYDFENFRENTNPLISLDLLSENIYPASVVVNGNLIYVISASPDEIEKVISYRYSIENGNFVINKISEYIVPDMRAPVSVVYHKGKLFIGDSDSDADPISVIDVSNPESMVKISSSVGDLSQNSTIVSLCSSEKYVHIIYRESNTFKYCKISDVPKDENYPLEKKNIGLSLIAPKKIISFGRYVAILEKIDSGDDKILILDTEKENAPLISSLTNNNIPNIEDIIFYKDAIYVLGEKHLYPIEIQSANVTNSDIESLSTDYLFTRNINIYGSLNIGGNIYTKSNMDSDGISKIYGSMYISKGFSLGSSDKSDSVGAFIYGKDMLQECSDILYIGSDSLQSGYNGGIAIDNDRIYNFDESGSNVVEFRVNPLGGTNIITGGALTASGLTNSRYAVASNGYVYNVDAFGNLYCFSLKNSNFDLLSRVSHPSATYWKSPTGLISNGNLVVSIYNDQFAAYEVSDPYNIQGKFGFKESYSSIKEMSFYGRKVQELLDTPVSSFDVNVFQYVRYFDPNLNGVLFSQEESYAIRTLVNGIHSSGFQSNVISLYRDGDLFYGLKNDGNFAVARLLGSGSNSIGMEIDNLELTEESIFQGKIIRYGESLFVFTNIGVAIVNIQNKTKLKLNGWFTNQTEGFNNNPFGFNFDVQIIGTNIFLIRNNVVYKMSIKGSSISHIESGSFSVINFMNYSDIDVGEDAYLGSVLAGGYLSAPSEYGITSQSFSANRISINRLGLSQNGYRETDWSFEIVNGGVVGESPNIEYIDNFVTFDSESAGVMIPVGDEIFVFSSSGPFYSIVSMVNTNSPEVYDSLFTNTVPISGMPDSGVIAAFSYGRKVYAVNSSNYSLFTIDTYSREQKNISFTMPSAGTYKGHIVIGNYLYWATGESVTRYIIQEERLINNGSYFEDILGISYGEGKLFVVTGEDGNYSIRSTKTATDIYDGSLIDSSSDTLTTDRFLDIKFFKNKLYLLSMDNGEGSITSFTVSDLGVIGSASLVTSSSEISDGLEIEIFEDRIYVFQDRNDIPVVVYNISGEKIYSISDGIELKNHLIYKNKIFGTDENSSNIYLYRFLNSNFSIGEFGSIVTESLEITNRAKFTEGGYFRNGIYAMDTIFSSKEITASKGFSGQAVICMKKNTNQNIISDASTHATNLSSQPIDLFFSKSVSLNYIDFVYQSLSNAFVVNPANGSTGLFVNIRGLYQIKFTGSIYRSISGPIELHLSVNNKSVDSHVFYIENTTNSDGHHISCSFLAEINSGDTVKIFGTRNLSGPSSPITFKENSMLHIEKIS